MHVQGVIKKYVDFPITFDLNVDLFQIFAYQLV